MQLRKLQQNVLANLALTDDSEEKYEPEVLDTLSDKKSKKRVNEYSSKEIQQFLEYIFSSLIQQMLSVSFFPSFSVRLLVIVL